MHKFCKLRGIAALLAILTLIGLTGCHHQKNNDKKSVEKFQIMFYPEEENGTVKAAVDGEIIKPGTEIEKGKRVVFTATPDSTYKLAGWTLNGETQNTTTLSYTVTVTKKTEVRAKFIDDLIDVKAIKVGDAVYGDEAITVEESTAVVAVELEGVYENLNVKINETECPVNDNAAQLSVSLKKKLNKINIEVNAKDKKPYHKEISVYYKSLSVVTLITIDGAPQNLSELNDSKLIITRELKPVVVLNTTSKFESIKAENFSQEMDGYKKTATLTLKDNIQPDVELPISIEVTTTDDEARIITFKLKRPRPQIDIESVTLNNKSVQKDSTVNVNKTNADLIIGFKEAYKGLAVTVNDDPANVAGAVANYSFTLSNGENNVVIKANADEAQEVGFSFTINYAPPVLGDIVLSAITINDKDYIPNAVNIVNTKSAKIEVKLDEEYEDVLVKVNDNPTNQPYTHKKIFNYTITDLTSAETPVKIEITATGKNKKTIDFNLKYEAPQERIVQKVEVWEEDGSNWVEAKFKISENEFSETLYAMAFTKLKITIEPGGTRDFSKFKMKVTRIENSSVYIEDAVFKMELNSCICEIQKSESLKDGQYVKFKLELFYDNSSTPIETQTIALKGQDVGGGGWGG